MPTNSPMHSWIRFWIKRNDHEFEEQAKKVREGNLRLAESGVSLRTLELIAQYDLDRHQRNQFPVGAFFDMINSQRHGGVKATAEQLFVVARSARTCSMRPSALPTTRTTRSSSSRHTNAGVSWSTPRCRNAACRIAT